MVLLVSHHQIQCHLLKVIIEKTHKNNVTDLSNSTGCLAPVHLHSTATRLRLLVQGVEGSSREAQQENELHLLEGVTVKPDWQVCPLSDCKAWYLVT